MDIIFAMPFGWLFLTQYSLYVQTGAWNYLVTSLGALLNLLFFVVRDTWEFAGLLFLLGSILFAVGLASTLTFGGKLEIDRLHVSSWKDILIGRAPAHLRKGGPSERKDTILTSSLCLLSALIAFLGGKLVMALNLTVFGIVYAIYAF